MIQVSLPQFEGPLALLLHLIRREEMDIYNIPIHRITQQYMDHIKRMRELDLEVAGDFIAMAATLIHIKSRMLLPQYNENGELIEESEDPRKELVQKLIEYQMYQEASQELNKRPLLGRDIWARGMKEDLPVEEGDIVVDEGGLFALISMYRKVIKQIKKNVHTVMAKGQSIASRILELRDRLVPGRRVGMSELILPLERTKNKVLITFLSLLELTKMGFTTLFQTDNYGEIYIDTKSSIERDVIERVEEYDKKPEDAERISQEIEVDAWATIPLEIQYDKENPESQQIALGEIPEPPVEPDAATDEEILAEEEQMGLHEGAVDLSRVDQALEAFSLEAPQTEPLLMSQDKQSEISIDEALFEEVSVETAEELPEIITAQSEEDTSILEESDEQQEEELTVITEETVAFIAEENLRETQADKLDEDSRTHAKEDISSLQNENRLEAQTELAQATEDEFDKAWESLETSNEEMDSGWLTDPTSVSSLASHAKEELEKLFEDDSKAIDIDKPRESAPTQDDEADDFVIADTSKLSPDKDSESNI